MRKIGYRTAGYNRTLSNSDRFIIERECCLIGLFRFCFMVTSPPLFPTAHWVYELRLPIGSNGKEAAVIAMTIYRAAQTYIGTGVEVSAYLYTVSERGNESAVEMLTSLQ